jgi:hypothetical protein
MRLNERKIVKTISLKKVSAVAVASLGFGLLSVVPAYAAEESLTSINLLAATANGNVQNVEQSIFVGGAATGTDIDTGDTVDFKATLTSSPAGGFVTVIGQTGEASLGFTGDTPGDTGSSGVATYTATANATGGATTVTATGTNGLVKFSFTPTKPGTHVILVWNDQDLDGVMDVTEARADVSITITAAAGYSSALSTAYLAEDLTDDNTGVATAVTNATASPLAISTIGQKAAQIVVVTRDSNNAIYTGQAITATVSGSGFVSAGSTTATDGAPTATEANAGDGSATTTRTAAVTAAANTTGVVTIGVWGDGTAGTGTITISVTDQVSGATTTLATKTVTWYSGTAAKLEVTTLQSIATPGAANGCSNATTCTQATLALTPAYVIKATDSGGRLIPGLTITGTPTDTTVIASTSVAIVTGGDDKNGRGYYNASVTGGAAANVGKKSTITWSTTLADGVTKITTTSEASLAGTPATVTWTLDKATYTPGSSVVITVSAKDAAGNAAADGTYTTLHAGASTLGGSITGSTPAASVEILGGKATYTAFAPGTAGTYTVKNTFGASMPSAQQGASVSASIVVSDPNAAIMTQIDALNAKIVALNALIAKIMKKLGVK